MESIEAKLERMVAQHTRVEVVYEDESGNLHYPLSMCGVLSHRDGTWCVVSREQPCGCGQMHIEFATDDVESVQDRPNKIFLKP